MMEPVVTFEAVEPESIIYKRGTVFVKLVGFNAWLYRAMIGVYGKAEATERFWWLWHNKSDCLSPETAASLERAIFN